MVDPDLHSIYSRYNSELKPLIAEFEARNESFIDSLLDDIPAIFDYIALYKNSRNPKYLEQASFILDKATDDVRLCLIGAMMKDEHKFKSRFSRSVLESIDGGHFCGQYSDLISQIKSLKNTDNARSYDLLKQVEKLRTDSHDSIMAAKIVSESKVTTGWKWVISILFALIVNFLFQHFF